MTVFPTSGSLRSYEKDVIVVLQFHPEESKNGDDDNRSASIDDNNGDDANRGQNNSSGRERTVVGSKMVEKEYKYYGLTLAKQSMFMDAHLVSERKEQGSRRIVLKDVTPKVFESAMKFLEDPLATRSMGLEDVELVISFYDKYLFEGGRTLCDHIVSTILKTTTPPLLTAESITATEDLDIIVTLISWSDNYNLTQSKKLGIEFLSDVFNGGTAVPWNILLSCTRPSESILFEALKATRMTNQRKK